MNHGELLGWIDDQRVSLCRHEKQRHISSPAAVSYAFYDCLRQPRESLLDVLHQPDEERPYSGRILAYYPFQFSPRQPSICLRRDQIRIAVFTQLNTYSDPYQHMNLMVWLLSTELGGLLSERTIRDFHKHPRPLHTDADRLHEPLVSHLLELVVINRGGFLGWIQRTSPKRVDPIASDSTDDVLDLDEDLCFEDEELHYLHDPDEDEPADTLYEQFEGLQLKAVFNPAGVGSLSGYEDDQGPSVEELVDEQLRNRFLEELDAVNGN